MESIRLQRGHARAQQLDPKVFLPKLDTIHSPETITELDQVVMECFLNQPVPIFSWMKNIENRGQRDIVSPVAEPQPLTGPRESHKASSADYGLTTTEAVLGYKASNLDIGNPGLSSNITCNSDGLRNPDSGPRSVTRSNDEELENIVLHPDPIGSGLPLPEARDQIVAMQLADDIDHAMSLAKNAASTAETAADRAEGLVSLGLFLYQNYLAKRAAKDLDKAIQYTQKAIGTKKLDNNGLTNAQNSLSIFFKERFLMRQNKEDLHEAIAMARGAIDKAEGHALATCLSNLTSFLIRRYQVAGAQADLDEAVQASRRAVEIATEAHPDNSGLLNNLAGTWAERFGSIGNIADIDEAVYLARQAVKKAPKGSSSKAGALSTLASCLYRRAIKLTDINNLNEAIQAAQKSYDLTFSSDTNGSRILCNLGMMLGKRYQFSHNLEDLHQSIKKIEQAVLKTPLPDPERADRLNSLGLAHYNRFMVIRKDDPHDLEHALLRCAQAVNASTSQADSGRPIQLLNLATMLTYEVWLHNDIGYLPLSYMLETLAFKSPLATSLQRVEVAKRLLRSPLRVFQGQEVAAIAKEALTSIPQLVPPSLNIADKQHLLLGAAAMLLKQGRAPTEAVICLEIGRAVLASDLLDLRADISVLEASNSNLAQRFKKCREVLDAPMVRTEAFPEKDSIERTRSRADERQDAQDQFDAIVKEIRNQSGFENFLRPLDAHEILEASENGAIIMVNISKVRSDALIIQRKGILAIGLPQDLAQKVPEYRKSSSFSNPAVLEWLWRNIVGPILEDPRLELKPREKGLLRVWWIPTGPLVGLPLHAAGLHLQAGKKTALDLVISSYATSIRSIVQTRRRRPSEGGTGTLVRVALNDTPSILYHAIREADEVQAFSGRLNLTPVSPEKNKEAVRKAIRDCEIFHFAGHGFTHQAGPLLSFLYLEDWRTDPLTVQSLMEINLDHHRMPFLAYLSACGTGENRKEESADENIHLASACQLAGFRHVIGTLWRVDDEVCVTMAKHFYTTLAAEGLRDASVSYALHHASRQQRDAWVQAVNTKRGSGKQGYRDAVLVEDENEGNLTWVPYVHYGI